MPLWDSVKELVINGASTTELKAEAIRLGMQTLRMAGLAKLKTGMTSIEEVVGTPLPIRCGTRELHLPNLHQLLKRWWRRDRPISTSPPAPAAAPHRRGPRTAQDAAAHPVETKQLCYSILADAQKHKFEEERARPLVRCEGPLPLPRQHLHAAWRGAAAFRTIPSRS